MCGLITVPDDDIYMGIVTGICKQEAKPERRGLQEAGAASFYHLANLISKLFAQNISKNRLRTGKDVISPIALNYHNISGLTLFTASLLFTV